MRLYPALELTWREAPDDAHVERLLAAIDDESPTAVEERDDSVRVFFGSGGSRARAQQRLTAADSTLSCQSIDVSDENWAARSQAGLQAVRVGRIVVFPRNADAATAASGDIAIVIPPSMGFGTGHHASTRLCLQLLQQIPIDRCRVLDAGTGSGVLAIAAWKLGAAKVTAIDVDPDALEAAADNITLNGAQGAVTALLAPLSGTPQLEGRSFDLILANLTGALLVREAATFAALAAAGGRVIASGFQPHEDDEVTSAFARAGLTHAQRVHEDNWVGAIYVTNPTGSTAL